MKIFINKKSHFFLCLIILWPAVAISLEATGIHFAYFNSRQQACDLANTNARNKIREQCRSQGGHYDTKKFRKASSACSCKTNKNGEFNCRVNLSFPCAKPIVEDFVSCDGSADKLSIKKIAKDGFRISNSKNRTTTIRIDKDKFLSQGITVDDLKSSNKYKNNMKWLCGGEKNSQTKRTMSEKLVKHINSMRGLLNGLASKCKSDPEYEDCFYARKIGLVSKQAPGNSRHSGVRD